MSALRTQADVQKQFRNLVLRFSIGLAAIMLLLVYAQVKHVISIRIFAFTLITVNVTAVIVLTALIFRLQRTVLAAGISQETQDFSNPLIRKQTRRSIWFLRVNISLMVMGLIIGINSTQDDGVLPRLVGVTINLAINYVLIRRLIQLQRQMKVSIEP
jgi:hypothetical protein